MTPEEKAAMINARCVTAMIRAMGLQAENAQCVATGGVPKNGKEAFDSIIIEEGTHWNAIADVLHR
jgi:hypothetical protein